MAQQAHRMPYLCQECLRVWLFAWNRLPRNDGTSGCYTCKGDLCSCTECLMVVARLTKGERASIGGLLRHPIATWDPTNGADALDRPLPARRRHPTAVLRHRLDHCDTFTRRLVCEELAEALDQGKIPF